MEATASHGRRSSLRPRGRSGARRRYGKVECLLTLKGLFTTRRQASGPIRAGCSMRQMCRSQSRSATRMLPTRLLTSIQAFVLAWALAYRTPLADDREQLPPRDAGAAVSYERDLAPLLRSKCARCHGLEGRKADFDLTTAASLLKGGESGPAVVIGKPDESLLYEKIHAGEMPPDEPERLSSAQIELVRRWIIEGAKVDVGPGAFTDSAASPTQHDVLPILLRRCAPCHGRNRREAGLDLRTKAAMLHGGKSGPAIVPGRPEESLLIKQIRDDKMPPRDRLVEVSIKPIETSETAVIARWLELGAPEITISPDVATTSPDPLVSDEDRDYWAFRSPQSVAVPKVGQAERVRNPIDAFVLARLEPTSLSLAPEADRLTLLRRATYDLTGLPPSPEEVATFLADEELDAYERLIDRLLASPRYGERWGRYWLDAAGYADSEGKREQDLPRPHAWRYRDYVIRSFNADRPYDRFLLEQIAGDELADYEHGEITPEIYDNLVATGFLRMASDATWANITGYLTDRLEVIADEIDVLGSAVMGLTLKCARCHSHKFDPIPQRDYYRLADVFKGAYDEFNWLKPDLRDGAPLSQDTAGTRQLTCVTSAERSAWEAHEASIDAELKAAKDRAAADAEIKAIEARRQPEPRIHALWDRGDPSPTYVYRRGDPMNLGPLVGPGVPSVLTDGRTPFDVEPPWPGAKQTGRRLAFARWLTRPDHPLTARVAVNRIWRHHFGSGIVKTLGNFGKAGARPTHPELLDWLAHEFVRQGWSTKAMHRLLMTSSTYRQASAVTENQDRLDPANALYSRMPLMRLDAESLYDSLVFVAGRLDGTPFGPADLVQARPDGLVTPQATPRGWRRLIYVQQLRKTLTTHLESFDYPQMSPNCLERRESMVAPQALHLMNNGMVFGLAEQFAMRVKSEAGAEPAAQVERTYLIALGRSPNDDERSLGLSVLTQLAAEWQKQLGAGGPSQPEAAQDKALVAFCHAMLNSASFLYVD
ncbi:MAG TPA: PSD1 and planctomycete cytochrome C domain-containing protein [Pirellulales bacterium]|nr:PSD1 and planctomycete cytochrome C domain-containing protein [Pirellulales bacterium]